jgi:hypothetical protein
MEVSGQLHAPATLLSGKEPQYPLDRRLDGPQGRSGRGGEEKNSQPLPGLEPRSSSSYCILTLVYQQYRWSNKNAITLILWTYWNVQSSVMCKLSALILKFPSANWSHVTGVRKNSWTPLSTEVKCFRVRMPLLWHTRRRWWWWRLTEQC